MYLPLCETSLIVRSCLLYALNRHHTSSTDFMLAFALSSYPR